MHLAHEGALVSIPAHLDYVEAAALCCAGITAWNTLFVAGNLTPGATVLLRAEEPTHLLLLGGDPLDGPRYISWNFVSSSRERLEQAADDWRNQRFERIEGETSYIPLPGDGDGPVNYP